LCLELWAVPHTVSSRTLYVETPPFWSHPCVLWWPRICAQAQQLRQGWPALTSLRRTFVSLPRSRTLCLSRDRLGFTHHRRARSWSSSPTTWRVVRPPGALTFTCHIAHQRRRTPRWLQLVAATTADATTSAATTVAATTPAATTVAATPSAATTVAATPTAATTTAATTTATTAAASSSCVCVCV